MKILFKDLYTTMKDTKRYINEMGVDLDNVDANSPRCIISGELDRLIGSYLDLYNADIVLNVDLNRIKQYIENCLSCIDL